MEDLRKNYIVSLISNYLLFLISKTCINGINFIFFFTGSYFVLKETPIDENNKYLNYFLDDGNCLILYVLYDKNGNLSFTNNVHFPFLKTIIIAKNKSKNVSFARPEVRA